MIRRLLALLLVIGLWPVAAGLEAGPLDSVFQKVDQAAWGEKQAAVKKGLSPLLTDKAIIVVADGGLDARSTLNYLFKKKGGGLYNLAWYTTTPARDIKAALALEARIEKSLKAKYGAPMLSHADGRPGDAAEVEKKLDDRARAMKSLDEAKAAKGSELTGEEMMKSLDVEAMLALMPVIFYSKLNFWDGNDLWVVSNLLCSNDGNCYQHLQFVSKEQGQDESYQPTPQRPFSYTTTDRDQDLVTKFNRSLSQ